MPPPSPKLVGGFSRNVPAVNMTSIGCVSSMLLCLVFTIVAAAAANVTCHRAAARKAAAAAAAAAFTFSSSVMYKRHSSRLRPLLLPPPLFAVGRVHMRLCPDDDYVQAGLCNAAAAATVTCHRAAAAAGALTFPSNMYMRHSSRLWRRCCCRPRCRHE